MWFQLDEDIGKLNVRIITGSWMGAQKSIHAGNAKIDMNADFTSILYRALMPHRFWDSANPLSLVIGSLGIQFRNSFGKGKKLGVLWDKGPHDSNLFIVYRNSKPENLNFVLQHSISPEIVVHGVPVDNLSSSGSGGLNLCRYSAGLDLIEPASSRWSNKLNLKFEHARPVNDDGRPVSRDLHGFPVTCSGGFHDNMVVVKHESRFAEVDKDIYTTCSMQLELGVQVLTRWSLFQSVKFSASNCLRIGRGFLLTRLTGGAIHGDIAPYQAFAIGGVGSVRGYGRGAVGSGRCCVVANSELLFPLNRVIDGMIYADCGSDLGSACHVPGNPALRHGKPGSGVSIGCLLRVKSPIGDLEVDCAVNALQKRTLTVRCRNLVS